MMYGGAQVSSGYADGPWKGRGVGSEWGTGPVIAGVALASRSLGGADQPHLDVHHAY